MCEGGGREGGGPREAGGERGEREREREREIMNLRACKELM